jgi:hypothetical protein
MDFEALGRSHQCGLERKIMQNVFLRLIDFSPANGMLRFKFRWAMVELWMWLIEWW